MIKLARFYTYKDQLLAPKVAQAKEGFFLDTDPVTICDLQNESGVRSVLHHALTSETEVIETPEPSQEHDPGSPILDALHLKKWLKFEADAAMYSVHFYSDHLDYYSTGRAVDGSWRQQNMRHVRLPVDYGSEPLIETIINDMRADNPAPMPPRSGGLMIMPSDPES